MNTSRQVLRRLMFRQAFNFLTGKFGGEKRGVRRSMAWRLAKKTIRDGRQNVVSN